MGSFFLPFSFFLYSHITSCIRDSLHFVPRFAPSKCVRCGTSSILFSPTKRKHHVIRSVGFFIAIFLFSLQSYNLLHPRLTTFCASLCSFKMCSLRNQFDPVIAHHNEKFHVLRAVGFFIAIFLPPYLSFNLLHPRSRSFARRFAPSNDVRCGTSSILSSPTIRKHHVIRSVGFFIAISLFSLQSYNLLHPRLTIICASLCSFK